MSTHQSSSRATESGAPDDRATALTALLTTAPDNRDHAAVRAFMHDAADLGLALLLVYPDAKVPADMRTPHQRRDDDNAARRAAKQAGNSAWRKVRSASGVTLATTDTAALDHHLDAYLDTFGDDHPDGVPVSLAVAVGPSRLVVVDADTPGQVAGFNADAGTDAAPTVSTPGQVDPATGEWVHSDGGHWWYTVPETVELPDNAHAITLGADDADGYAALFGARRYVLIPPSTRPEGTYKATGSVEALPDWLRDAIEEHGRRRAERAAHSRDRDAAARSGDPVKAWGAGTTWTEILAPTGWMETGKVYTACGCDIWTAPGAHGTDRSAVAHEQGCPEYADADPPLCIFTTGEITPFAAVARPGAACRVLTRLSAVAAIHYDNDEGAAMTALMDSEYGDDASDALTLDDDLDADAGRGASASETGSSASKPTVKVKRRLRITCAADIEPEPVKWLWVDITGSNFGRDTSPGSVAPDPHVVDDIALVAPGRTWTAPDVEFNGRIPCGMVTIAAGREGTGKSSFAIWLAAHITRGTLPGLHYGAPRGVFYVATEDSWKHTLVPRLVAAGADMRRVFRVEAETQESATLTISLPGDIGLLAAAITEYDVALVVVDPLMSTLGSGLNSNDSREVRSALEPLAQMADETSASVVGIAHFNKATGLDSSSRITGSGAFKDVARAVMVFAHGADDRVFSQPKNSVGSSDLPSLNYSLTPAVVETPKGKAATAVFAFTRIAEESVDDGLGNEHRNGGNPSAGKSPVEQFIVDYITEHADAETGEVPAADVIDAGAGAGFSESQITKARSRITDPVVSHRREGFGPKGRTLWKIAR